MQLNISQQMKMSQQMKLAPRMIQSMEILQLPIIDLQERIDQEMLENVVLEKVSPNSENDDENGETFDTETLQGIEQAREEATATAVEEKELVRTKMIVIPPVNVCCFNFSIGEGFGKVDVSYFVRI